MFLTVLPVADTKYLKDTCAQPSNGTTPLIVAQRVLKLLSGMGLSINGKHVYCGDYIYSGHTMSLIMGFLVIKQCKYYYFYQLEVEGGYEGGLPGGQARPHARGETGGHQLLVVLTGPLQYK